MKHKSIWTGIAASVGMLILIIDGKTALAGAQAGIELCLKTVIPSLFPFFLLSNLLTTGFAGTSLPVLRPLGRLCGVPDGAESILLSGFLGGYPVGAQSISEAYHAGMLKKADAEHMLAFCNNAGPAFLFGMVSQMFPSQYFAWALWLIHVSSAVLVSIIAQSEPSPCLKISGGEEIHISNALQSAIRIMAAVCGWVILFRVLIAFFDRWFLWILPVESKVWITGLLELSNGCCELGNISDVSTRFIICSAMLAFGGVCVTLQTSSVTGKLSLKHYFKGKLLQTLFSVMLSFGLVHHSFIPVFGILLLFLSLLRRAQKKSSIRRAVRV